MAKHAGVSVASASRALNEHANVSDGMRSRVRAAADQLKFVPHSGARSLTTRRSHAIGVVLPDLFGEFFSELIRGIDRAAHRQGLHLLLSNMHGSEREVAAAVQAMRGRVDGMLVMAPGIGKDYLVRHLPPGLPAVVLNGEADGFASVTIDNAGGARAATAFLVQIGRRHIACIGGRPGNGDADGRLVGFRRAVADLLDDCDPMVVLGDFTEESGAAAARELIASGRPLDAIFCANDMMAIGCQLALRAAGVGVPGDIAIMGFDDIPAARYVSPALSTMRVHIDELGAAAFDRLMAVMADPADVPPPLKLCPDLVVRQSAPRLEPDNHALAEGPKEDAR